MRPAGTVPGVIRTVRNVASFGPSGEFNRARKLEWRFHRNTSLVQRSIDRGGIVGAEHQSVQPEWRRQNLRPSRLTGRGGDQFQIFVAEDRQMVHRSQRVIAARGHREAEPAVGLQPRIDPITHVDDDVIERRHRQCRDHGVASPSTAGAMLLRRRARHQPRTMGDKVTAPRRAPPSLGGNVTRRWQEAIRRTGDIGLPGSMFKLTVARDHLLQRSTLDGLNALMAWSALTMTDASALLGHDGRCARDAALAQVCPQDPAGAGAATRIRSTDRPANGRDAPARSAA